MCALNSTTKNWLEEKLIPKLKNVLGKSECTIEWNISIPDNSFFVSKVIFLELKFNDVDKKCENKVSQVLIKINLVVKCPPNEKHIHKCFNIDAYFHNEILFYTKYAKHYKNCPGFIYAFEKPPLDSTIVIENMSPEGYLVNPEKMNTKYILAAVRELARFHATGYILKENNPKNFFEIVKDIHNFRNKSPRKLLSVANYLVPRMLRYLRNQKYDEDFCNKLERFLSDSYSNIVLGMTEPVEPLATLCHGDFTGNNILFKENNGRIKAKFIDFAMMTYCSPSTDLSFFLFLNGSKEHRNEKFPEIFGIYCDTLLQTLKEGGLSNLERFSKELLLEDYKIHALYGYSLVSAFLPVYMGYSDANVVLRKEIQEVCQTCDYVGGDELTKVLVDMISDLKETGCLDHILNI